MKLHGDAGWSQFGFSSAIGFMLNETLEDQHELLRVG
jgi:hypothetical protein